MIWVVLLVIALVAYFIVKGLHVRHVSRCQTDTRTAEHVPDTIRAYDAHNEFHKQSAATAAQVHSEREPSTQPSTQSTPSLLYGDRNRTARNPVGNNNQYFSEQYRRQSRAAETHNTSTHSGNTQCTVDDVIDMELATNPSMDCSLDSTAEHQPMGDVGVPASNREYAAGNAPEDSNSGVVAGGAAVAAAAGIAAATRHADADYEDEFTTQNSEIENPHAKKIDLELGESDNTFNDDDDIEGDNHDELLDFGDLTSDISDMLKELNLRETDSPRLDINKDEYAQLKTGEPGEVKPAKIENVADKLRNMLQ